MYIQHRGLGKNYDNKFWENEFFEPVEFCMNQCM